MDSDILELKNKAENLLKQYNDATLRLLSGTSISRIIFMEKQSQFEYQARYLNAVYKSINPESLSSEELKIYSKLGNIIDNLMETIF